ncbi:putative bifunctional diguanylate cyclase/phosphodiesterase [Lichenicoccus sp.]|uniref:putative bifunctional diguanylate cyclase/phosphodiesterase n=1 Tax=Lichenicoccus sp. TaxID=2781899 RepID=UPI003D0A832B
MGLVTSALAALAVVGFLVWLGLNGATLRDRIQRETTRAVRVAELRGTIATLNETLGMSARMAALSGQSRWVERYNTALPRLTAAIAEAVKLATPKVAAELGPTMDEANTDLVTMERAAMTRAAAGDKTGAMLLLDGPEFDYLQASYDTGIDAFSQDLMILTAVRAASLNDRAWEEALGLALAAVLLVAATFASFGHAQLRRALARTETVARTDPLTGLPNRRHLYEQLDLSVARLQRGGTGLALLLLDLDRFKPINDLHGHPAGDRLLQLVAARLREAARSDDLVARLGGDEFALVIEHDGAADPAPDHLRGEDAASALAGRVIAALEAPFELEGGIVVRVGVSIGIASAPPGCESAEVLIHRADVALYHAKSDQRGSFSVFTPGMDAAPRLRALLEEELRQAIAADDIVPYFQPLVEIENARLVGFEMLARWPHPVRGMISPADFIPIAEETGLIGAMTQYLLRRACRIALAWPSDVSLACNISALQLRDRSLPAMIKTALDQSGLAAHRLELEITESALVGDLNLARAILLELKALGVRLALDDFGTGYASLRHLQMLPFDTLKIDASFVAAMAGDSESRKIVTAVIGLAKSLGLTVVAEGVEEPETAALLSALNCDLGQGWLFGRPGPAETARLLLMETCEARLVETYAVL